MLRAMGFTMAATLVGQVLNFFTDILMANYFGTSWRADAYLLALIFPVIVYDLFITGIGATFIPLYVSRQKTGDEQSFFSTVVNLTVLTALLISAILFFLIPYLINFIASGFSQEAKRLTVVLSRLLLFLVVTMPLSAVLSNLLNAHNRFAITALGKASIFAGIILAILFLVKGMGIFSVVLGFFVGTLLFITVLIYLVRKTGIRFTAAIHIRHPALKEMGILLLPLLIASLANYVNIFVERSVAAGFPEGSIAALNYAFKVINIPVNLFVIAAMIVVLPGLSKHASNGEMDSLSELTIKCLRFITFAMAPIITGLIIFKIPLIKLLFERGEFTAQSTAVTASATLFYVFGILGLSAVTLLSRVFYALKDLKTLSKISISMILINIILILVLSKTIGFAGIPLTFSIVYTIHMAVMITFLGKRHGVNLSTPFLKGFIKHVLASGIMAVACLPLLMGMGSPLFSSMAGRLSYLLLAALTGAISYALASSLLRAEEVDFVLEKARAFKYKLFKGQEGKSIL